MEKLLVTRIVELINAQKHCASVHSYGTVMMDEAANNQVSDRDNLRHLPVSQQKELQNRLQKIAELTDDVVFVDTHAFISTDEDSIRSSYHVIQILNQHILQYLHAQKRSIIVG